LASLYFDSRYATVHGIPQGPPRRCRQHPHQRRHRDCTEEFDAIHSDKAGGLLEMHRVGELVITGNDYSPQNSHADLRAIDEAPAVAMPAPLPVSTIALCNPREKVRCRLVDKKSLSYNVRLFWTALLSPDQKLGLPTGRHVKLCMRAYTPMSPVDEVCHIKLLIKIYFKGEDPKYPAAVSCRST